MGKTQIRPNGRRAKDHRATTNSNLVLRSVKYGPPNWTKARTLIHLTRLDLTFRAERHEIRERDGSSSGTCWAHVN